MYSSFRLILAGPLSGFITRLHTHAGPDCRWLWRWHVIKTKCINFVRDAVDMVQVLLPETSAGIREK